MRAGQTIQVWAPNLWTTTDPSIVYAEFIVIEASYDWLTNIDWSTWLISGAGIVTAAGFLVLLVAFLRWVRRSQRWLKGNP